MLKQRVITAVLLLLALILPFMLLSQHTAMSILRIILVSFCVVAVYEWGNLLPIKSARYARLVSICLSGLMAFCLLYLVANYKQAMTSSSLFISLNALSLVGMFIFLCRLPTLAQTTLQFISVIFCFLWSSAAVLLFDSFSSLGTKPGQLLLSAALPVWLADSVAYFAGKRWGKTKLAPHISPGKTWEGALGGLLSVLFFHTMAALFWQNSVSFILFTDWHFASFLLVVVWVAVSIAGDLFESKLKRLRGVKDSGFILPGHGGVLDRIDALLPALAFVSLLFLL